MSVLINNTMSLRLILQLALDHFCTEYALLTACRNFEHLYSGNNYETIEPVFHISFLNYSLFPEYPEFYSSYQLMNISNPACCCTYSDKLLLSIIDLSQISKAVKEDKDYDIDLWARLLTASTWRELEVLEQTNDYLQAAVETLRQFMENEIICQQCHLRENAAHLERLRHKKIKELDEGLLLTQEELQLAQGELRQTQGELKLAQDLLRQKEEEVMRLRAELATFQQ